MRRPHDIESTRSIVFERWGRLILIGAAVYRKATAKKSESSKNTRSNEGVFFMVAFLVEDVQVLI